MDFRNLAIGLVISSVVFAIMLPLIIPAAPSLNTPNTNSTTSNLANIGQNITNLSSNLQQEINTLQSTDTGFETITLAFAIMSNFVITVAQLIIGITLLPFTFVDTITDVIIYGLNIQENSLAYVIINAISVIFNAVILLTMVISIVIFLTGRHLEV